jgi:hypothetical protein
MNNGLTGSSSWSVPRAMIIQLLARRRHARPAGPLAFLPLGRASSPRQPASAGRGGICTASGSSTSTWRSVGIAAIGASTMRAKPESDRRSTRATGPPAGRAGRRRRCRWWSGVADLHVGIAGHEAQFQRAAAPAPPKAALRCWVRVFSTGIAASLSVSRVTSAGQRVDRVTWPSTPASLITGAPATTPCGRRGR